MAAIGSTLAYYIGPGKPATYRRKTKPIYYTQQYPYLLSSLAINWPLSPTYLQRDRALIITKIDKHKQKHHKNKQRLPIKSSITYNSYTSLFMNERYSGNVLHYTCFPTW